MIESAQWAGSIKIQTNSKVHSDALIAYVYNQEYILNFKKSLEAKFRRCFSQVKQVNIRSKTCAPPRGIYQTK